MVQQQTHVRLISWSKPIGLPPPPLIGRGPDSPVRVFTFENVCFQTEREVSRDARSVANLARFSAFLDPHSNFFFF